jgi:hypothetical protein
MILWKRSSPPPNWAVSEQELQWYGHACDIITCASRCTLPEAASVKIKKKERDRERLVGQGRHGEIDRDPLLRVRMHGATVKLCHPVAVPASAIVLI